jgi:hypothetical protein
VVVALSQGRHRDEWDRPPDRDRREW